VAAAALDLPSTAAHAQGTSQEREFLSRVRRLTVDGRRAGEGYWSKDGRKLVFQSEREPGNPFYQIYLMDMASGDVSRVSPARSSTPKRTTSCLHRRTMTRARRSCRTRS
jgi:hypothetical protein